MAGNVGGFTSQLKLEVDPAGFTAGISLLKRLHTELKNIKDIAGTLGNMKLTVKFDNGNVSEEAKKSLNQGRLTKEQQQILRSYRNENELSKEKKAEQSEQDKKERDQRKQSEDRLRDFGSTLKWTIGILATFGASLAALVFTNSKENTSTSLSAAGLNMSPVDMYLLKRIGNIFGNGNADAFDQPLKSLRAFETEPGLKGNLNSDMAVGLHTGLGLNINSSTFNEPVDQLMNRIANAFLSIQKTGSKEEKLKADAFVSQEFGEGFLNTLLGMFSQGITTMEGAMTQAGNATVTTSSDIKNSQNFNVQSNRFLADISDQANKLAISLENSLLPSLKMLNQWLEDNKDKIANTLVSTGKLIAGLVTMNPAMINEARDALVYGGKSNQERLIGLGILNDKGALDEKGVSLFNPLDITSFEDKAKKLESFESKLQSLIPKGSQYEYLKLGVENQVQQAHGDVYQAERNALKYLQSQPLPGSSQLFQMLGQLLGPSGNGNATQSDIEKKLQIGFDVKVESRDPETKVSFNQSTNIDKTTSRLSSYVSA